MKKEKEGKKLNVGEIILVVRGSVNANFSLSLFLSCWDCAIGKGNDAKTQVYEARHNANFTPPSNTKY